MGVNYKNEPLQFRLGKDCDPAYSFSSYEHGDPGTPILRAYEGDPIRIRLMDGAHEESHTFNLHGLKWRQARRNLDSRLVSQQHIGISESFTIETYLPYSGDYLYAYEDVEDIWVGCWGLIRAYDQMVADLIPIGDRPLPPKRTKPLPNKKDSMPKAWVDERKFIKKGNGIREFDIVAVHANIIYNKYGDHDPYGMIFCLKEEMDDILCGKKNPEPLVIRGNRDEIIKINLMNYLNPEKFHNYGVHGYPAVKVDAFYPTSARVSMYAQLLDYDVKHSSGATVGFNPDQTVAPGETITYYWEVPVDVGGCNLWDMADTRNHKHHGLFGAFIAQPRGSKYFNTETGNQKKSGASVIVKNPYLPDYRDFVMILHDGARLLDKQGQLIIDPTDGILNGNNEVFDTYDQGSRGFNYRSERLINRFTENPDLKYWADSKVFGDPATPLFEAYLGEPVSVRLLVPADRRRTNTFTLHGHYWRTNWTSDNSSYKGVRGQCVAGFTFDMDLIGGAGGVLSYPGDYMYRTGNIRWNIELGIWGIMRVHERLQRHLIPIKRNK